MREHKFYTKPAGRQSLRPRCSPGGPSPIPLRCGPGLLPPVGKGCASGCVCGSGSCAPSLSAVVPRRCAAFSSVSLHVCSHPEETPENRAMRATPSSVAAQYICDGRTIYRAFEACEESVGWRCASIFCCARAKKLRRGRAQIWAGVPCMARRRPQPIPATGIFRTWGSRGQARSLLRPEFLFPASKSSGPVAGWRAPPPRRAKETPSSYPYDDR